MKCQTRKIKNHFLSKNITIQSIRTYNHRVSKSMLNRV